jgi:hypothetical protein
VSVSPQTHARGGKCIVQSVHCYLLTSVVEGKAKFKSPYSLCGDFDFWIDRHGNCDRGWAGGQWNQVQRIVEKLYEGFVLVQLL